MIDAVTIRWKQGFFRLWILLTALWALVVLALAQPFDTINQYRLAKADLDRISSAFIKIDEKIAAGGGTSESGIFYDVERLNGMREELETHQTPLEATVDDLPVRVIEFLSALIGVPLFLLGFGAALAWVLGGFKQSEKAKIQEP